MHVVVSVFVGPFACGVSVVLFLWRQRLLGKKTDRVANVVSVLRVVFLHMFCIHSYVLTPFSVHPP